MAEREKLTWVLEAEVFPDSHERMHAAVAEAGHEVLLWKDAWLEDDSWPRLSGTPVVFHGSLGNAAQLAAQGAWTPGAYCNTARFHCSSWYPGASAWLLQASWVRTTAAGLVESLPAVLGQLGDPDRFFVRPDSPLKPFSGRVLHRDAVTLAALDHGFYFDDELLPVIVAPVRDVGREWRYVVVGSDVVAGSAYLADGRTALPDDPSGEPWRTAAQIARALDAPEEVYVLDVCESDGHLRLLELNPFSGADLYACDRREVVAAVSACALAAR
jgi:hypothetical protein